jgi:hypothetical protein
MSIISRPWKAGCTVGPKCGCRAIPGVAPYSLRLRSNTRNNQSTKGVNMTASQLYWILKLDDFRSFAGFLGGSFLGVGVILLIAAFCALGAAYETHDEQGRKNALKVRNTLRPFSIVFLAIGLIFLTIRTLLPTTQEMAIIYVVPQVVNNVEVQKIPEKVVKLASDWLTELTPESIKSDIRAVIKDAKTKDNTAKKP